MKEDIGLPGAVYGECVHVLDGCPESGIVVFFPVPSVPGAPDIPVNPPSQRSFFRIKVLDVFAKQIVPGTVILFNEYWNHPTWKKHEFKAWQEHVAKHNVKYEYIGYASDHQEVAVKIY